MWNGKNKAVTFSFDDGCQQDIVLIKMLNKYGLKATFNLNPGDAGVDGSFPMSGRMVKRIICPLDKIKERYKGHEVAVHCYNHPDLTKMSDEQVIFQINKCQEMLQDIVGYPVNGMAYPGGCYNEHLLDVMRKNTTIKYSRSAAFYAGLNMPEEPLTWHQFWWGDPNQKLDQIIDEFLNYSGDEKKVLAIWGHSYELDGIDGLYEIWEKRFAKLANRDDIFYGTNIEVLEK